MKLDTFDLATGRYHHKVHFRFILDILSMLVDNVTYNVSCFVIIFNRMLQSCKSSEEATKLSMEGQALLQLIEDSPKPIVSAIMGLCLGGGLEVVQHTC